jgi:hypothetical protein
MDQVLEVGYLTGLFSEPVYLMEYETKKENVSIIQDLPVETIVPKLEIKKMPVLQTLQVPQKISRKCILLFQSEEDELTASGQTFLANMMKACNVNAGEYECVNFRGITINDIASRYSYNKLVLFGVTIQGLSIGQYTNTQVKSTQIISADDVWMLESNKSLKMQLWNQLQIMFGLLK